MNIEIDNADKYSVLRLLSLEVKIKLLGEREVIGTATV